MRQPAGPAGAAPQHLGGRLQAAGVVGVRPEPHRRPGGLEVPGAAATAAATAAAAAAAAAGRPVGAKDVVFIGWVFLGGE